MSRKVLFRSLKLLFFSGLAIALLLLAFRDVKVSDLIEGLKGANYVWLLISLAFGILAFLFRALRWKMLMEPFGAKPSVANAFHSVIIGYMANFAFPRMGEVARCGVLQRTEKIPFNKLVGTVVIERAFDLLCLLVLLTVVFFLKSDFFGAFIYDTAIKPIASRMGNAGVGIAIVVGAIVLLVALLYLVRKRLASNRFARKVIDFVKGIADGIKAGLKMKKRGKFLLYTAAIWVSYLVMTWCVFYTIPATSSLGIIDALFVLAISSIGMAMPVQGGFGAFHLIVAMGLSLYGISRSDGLLYATISHESQAAMTIIVGLISLSYIILIKKRDYLPKANDHEQTQSDTEKNS